jgi:predicted RNase H-like HicB family nuclease
MKAKSKHVARFERDEDGWWVVDIEGVQGCHTQARTIAQGKERIREALSLYIGESANTVEIEERVVLPAPVRRAVDRSLSKRERAEEAEAEASKATEAAVRAMLELGLSTRDAGELLGLTRQRVHQLANVSS